MFPYGDWCIVVLYFRYMFECSYFATDIAFRSGMVLCPLGLQSRSTQCLAVGLYSWERRKSRWPLQSGRRSTPNLGKMGLSFQDGMHQAQTAADTFFKKVSYHFNLIINISQIGVRIAIALRIHRLRVMLPTI